MIPCPEKSVYRANEQLPISIFPEICYIQHFGGHLGCHFAFLLTKNCSNLDDNLKMIHCPLKPMYRAKEQLTIQIISRDMPYPAF